MNYHIQLSNDSNNVRTHVLLANENANLSSSRLPEAILLKTNELIEKKVGFFHLYNQYDLYIIVTRKKANSRHEQAENDRILGFQIKNEIESKKITALNIQSVEKESTFLLDVLEGFVLSAYSFDKYKSEKKDNDIVEITIISDEITKNELNILQAKAEAINFTKDLVNEPVQYLNAIKFSEILQELSSKLKFDFEYFSKLKMQTLQMNGTLAVNIGSKDEPTFNILTYKPANAINSQPIIFIGKGVTFDTGGLNIKTAQMEAMKSDMAGAAAVAGLFHLCVSTQLPVYIIGLIPCTDNRPSGNAIVPSDIITYANKKTVEVLNTDAEGRLILADALIYAEKFNPKMVIDLATLTGAATRSIGTLGIAGMGNLEKKWFDLLMEASYETYERIVDLPLWPEYSEQIKSTVADLKNLGGPYAGAQTAAAFLKEFTNYPWYHLDIAPYAFFDTNDKYRKQGATAAGVRLLYQFLQKLTQHESSSR